MSQVGLPYLYNEVLSQQACRLLHVGLCLQPAHQLGCCTSTWDFLLPSCTASALQLPAIQDFFGMFICNWVSLFQSSFNPTLLSFRETPEKPTFPFNVSPQILCCVDLSFSIGYSMTFPIHIAFPPWKTVNVLLFFYCARLDLAR